MSKMGIFNLANFREILPYISNERLLNLLDLDDFFSSNLQLIIDNKFPSYNLKTMLKNRVRKEKIGKYATELALKGKLNLKGLSKYILAFPSCELIYGKFLEENGNFLSSILRKIVRKNNYDFFGYILNKNQEYFEDDQKTLEIMELIIKCESKECFDTLVKTKETLVNNFFLIANNFSWQYSVQSLILHPRFRLWEKINKKHLMSLLDNDQISFPAEKFEKHFRESIKEGSIPLIEIFLKRYESYCLKLIKENKILSYRYNMLYHG